MFGKDVERHDHEAGKPFEKPRQMLPQPREGLCRACHESRHEFPLGRHRHDDVLELANAGGDIVGLEPRHRDELREHGEGSREFRPVKGAQAQIHAAIVRIKNAYRRVINGAADDHLGLGTEARLRAHHRVQPHHRIRHHHAVRLRGPHRRDERLELALLDFHLGEVPSLDQGAGTASAFIVIVAFHEGSKAVRASAGAYGYGFATW